MMSWHQLNQAVTAADPGCAAAGLLHGQRPALSVWYGDPLPRTTVARLQVAAQRELQARLCAALPCFQVHVLQLVCHAHDQAGIGLEFEKLRSAANNTFDMALLELVYGQLLTSCKQTGARRHLADGFALAVNYLAANDYFALLRQHELLACLPLSETPSLPQKLASLLTEAAVIKQLQAGECRQYRQAHRDTVG